MNLPNNDTSHFWDYCNFAPSTDGAARAEAKFTWIMPSRERGRRKSTDGAARVMSNYNITKMDINTNIKKELLDDEVIQYIAHRHHVTADDVVDSVIDGDRIKVNLEDNENNIICDLIRMYNNNK